MSSMYMYVHCSNFFHTHMNTNTLTKVKYLASCAFDTTFRTAIAIFVEVDSRSEDNIFNKCRSCITLHLVFLPSFVCWVSVLLYYFILWFFLTVIESVFVFQIFVCFFFVATRNTGSNLYKVQGALTCS